MYWKLGLVFLGIAIFAALLYWSIVRTDRDKTEERN